MAYSVHITAKALREIDEALEWLSERSRPVALRWHQQLMEAVRSLENNPERFGLAPEGESDPRQIRQLLHGKRRGVYRILFERRDNTVFILRVRHSAQALLDSEEV